MNGSAPLCSLQGLLHLFYLDCQMGLKIPPQRHAGVFGCLPAGENLIIAQQCSLVIRVQDFQCADLESVSSEKSTRLSSTHFDSSSFSNHVTSVNDYHRYKVTDAYQINKTPEPILPVKQLQDGTERKGDGEEHGGVAAARCVRAFQQPQRVTDHICQDGVGQHADLESRVQQ